MLRVYDHGNSQRTRADRLAYHSQYRSAHRDESAAYHSRYRSAHRDESAAYRGAHRDESAAYRAAHRDELLPVRRAQYDELKQQLADDRRHHFSAADLAAHVAAVQNGVPPLLSTATRTAIGASMFRQQHRIPSACCVCDCWIAALTRISPRSVDVSSDPFYDRSYDWMVQYGSILVPYGDLPALLRAQYRVRDPRVWIRFDSSAHLYLYVQLMVVIMLILL